MPYIKGQFVNENQIGTALGGTNDGFISDGASSSDGFIADEDLRTEYQKKTQKILDKIPIAMGGIGLLAGLPGWMVGLPAATTPAAYGGGVVIKSSLENILKTKTPPKDREEVKKRAGEDLSNAATGYVKAAGAGAAASSLAALVFPTILRDYYEKGKPIDINEINKRLESIKHVNPALQKQSNQMSSNIIGNLNSMDNPQLADLRNQTYQLKKDYPSMYFNMTPTQQEANQSAGVAKQVDSQLRSYANQAGGPVSQISDWYASKIRYPIGNMAKLPFNIFSIFNKIR